MPPFDSAGFDAAGAIVESYVYDPYGKSLIRECVGRGDLTGDSVVDANDDQSMFDLARDCQLFDPRADIDNDGDVDGDDATLMGCEQAVWTGSEPTSVRMARSVHGNPYMFQGRLQFAIDTEEGATSETLLLNDHRNRFADPMTGRWLTRDPIGYDTLNFNLFESQYSNPLLWFDPSGLVPTYEEALKLDPKEDNPGISWKWNPSDPSSPYHHRWVQEQEKKRLEERRQKADEEAREMERIRRQIEEAERERERKAKDSEWEIIYVVTSDEDPYWGCVADCLKTKLPKRAAGMCVSAYVKGILRQAGLLGGKKAIPILGLAFTAKDVKECYDKCSRLSAKRLIQSRMVRKDRDKSKDPPTVKPWWIY